MHTAALFAFIAALQTLPAASTPPSTVVDDASTLAAATTNEGRFDALTALLRGRGLTFVVEPFTIEKPIGKEPRTEGRNITVTIGEGPELVVIGAHYVKQHPSDRVAAMLNFDINGFGDTVVFGPSALPGNAALRGKFVATCAEQNIPCVGFPQMPPGDDRNFVKAGVPTISVGIIPAVEAHQLWLMMNAGPASGLAPGTAPSIMRTIHTPDDVPAKLSEETMVRMQRFALALVRGVAAR